MTLIHGDQTEHLSARCPLKLLPDNLITGNPNPSAGRNYSGMSVVVLFDLKIEKRKTSELREWQNKVNYVALPALLDQKPSDFDSSIGAPNPHVG